MPDTRSALAELRRAPRILRLGIHRARDLERQLRDALDALLLRAELLVERDAVERDAPSRRAAA